MVLFMLVSLCVSLLCFYFSLSSSLLCAEGAPLLPFLVLPPSLTRTGGMVERDQVK